MDELILIGELEEITWFKFAPKQELKLRLKDMLESEVDKRYFLSEKTIKGFLAHKERHMEKGTGFAWKLRDLNGIASCLRANASLAPTDNTCKSRELS